MFQIITIGRMCGYRATPAHNDKILTQKELADRIDRLMAFHRTFEIFFNGQLIACGDDTGVYTIGKNRKKINFRA